MINMKTIAVLLVNKEDLNCGSRDKKMQAEERGISPWYCLLHNNVLQFLHSFCVELAISAEERGFAFHFRAAPKPPPSP